MALPFNPTILVDSDNEQVSRKGFLLCTPEESISSAQVQVVGLVKGNSHPHERIV
jgi:hypothetical protein